MKLRTILVAFIATALGFTAQAETTSSKVDRGNFVEGNLDREITNAKMRAESGSKSRYSASFNMGLDAGTLDEVDANSFGAEISGRFRINKNMSINAGIVTSVVSPLEGADSTQDNYLDKFDVGTPFVKISHYSRTGNLMLNYEGSIAFFTNSEETDLGLLAQANIGSTALYDFRNGIHAGVEADIFSTFADGRDLNVNFDDVSLRLIPFAEYAINDQLNLRTALSFGVGHSRFSQADGGHWENADVRHSFGLGYAPTRDIYIFPNITVAAGDFYADAELENSSIGVNATINTF